MAGIGAASFTLSCAGTTGALADRSGSDTKGETEPDDNMSHRLVISKCGQFVVVEVKSPSPHSYRGRLEVIPGDTVTVDNTTDVEVRLLFPEMRGMDEGSFVAVTSNQDSDCDFDELGKIPGLMAVALRPGGCFSLTIGNSVRFGRYEYVVLFDTRSLEPVHEESGFVSRWSHATGGSSSEFIIRKRR